MPRPTLNLLAKKNDLNLRVIFVGVVWIGLMFLLFTSPSRAQSIYFGWLPSRSIIHGFLFLGFVHIWTGTLRKQLKYEVLRKKASLIVFSSAVVLAVLSELIIYSGNLSSSVNYWNLIFDLFGASLGLLSFRLIYASN